MACSGQRAPTAELAAHRTLPPRDDGPPGDDARAPFEVELKQSGCTLTVEPGTSVLEAVRSAGVEVLSSCEECICDTCETDVLDGTPLHRDSLLTEDERAACNTMMLCVSRSRGLRLVLDL